MSDETNATIQRIATYLLIGFLFSSVGSCLVKTKELNTKELNIERLKMEREVCRDE